MNKAPSLATAVAILGTMVGLCGTAQAATVTFSGINDSVHADIVHPNELFVSTADFSANTYNIGLSDFLADGASAFTISALDTLSFLITAPANYVITKLTYSESGTYAITGGGGGGGVTVATGNWVVGGTAGDLGLHVFTSATGGWGLNSEFLFAVGANKTALPVSITNSLVAVGFGGGTAHIEKTAASVVVELTLVPLPASALLLGSALLGFTFVGRRRSPTA